LFEKIEVIQESRWPRASNSLFTPLQTM